MKRTIPLWITAATGFVLIAAHFSPYTERWGEAFLIWFDVLASIAFVLGGGNLLKVHLKKVSDRAAGWAYSAITVAAFMATIGVGLWKVGVPPAPQQEYFGEAFAPLAIADFPFAYPLEGSLSGGHHAARLRDSVVRQIVEEEGRLVFRGWMTPNQKSDLQDYRQDLLWQCAVERLAAEAQPPAPWREKLKYHAEHEALAFCGHMTEADRAALRKLSECPAWTGAVDRLFDQTQETVQVQVGFVPRGFDDGRARAISPALRFDAETSTLSVQGPMSVLERDALARPFPPAMPLPAGSPAREEFLARLRGAGPWNEAQTARFHAVLDAAWGARQLRSALDAAGQAEEVEKSPCEMLAEQERGVRRIDPKKKAGQDQALNAEQAAVLEEYVSAGWPTAELARRLGEAGPWSKRQEAALDGFLRKAPTAGARNKDLAVALMKAGPLTEAQQAMLLDDCRREAGWQRSVYALFAAAHQRKFGWSGDYRAQGSAFWWLYEYAMKPLTATMFSLLAFYVASAAFRAFRAKNLEATLLLATAFIILLGRTFAGVVATAWLPDWLSGLRIDNLTVTIMSVFNTAGSRAIKIGIALGIASTSLKVLLGIDRSYLGSRED